MRKTLKALLLVLLVVFVAAPRDGWSQGQVGGGLNGTVKDVSGAVIPTGKVSLISEATSSARIDNVDHAGHYSLNDVPPGLYTLIVEAGGFQKTKVDHVEVTLNQTRSLDVTLTVGGDTQTVEVGATNASVTTEQVETGR